jgi:hypothetical protein
VLKRFLPILMAVFTMWAAPLDAQLGRGVSIAPAAQDLPLIQGRQILVVIAVSSYEQWVPLASPVKDAREIRDILLSRYRIDQLYELYDDQATKANIIRLFARMQDEVEADDSLLILYCGHGHLDRKSDSGFWIPVNAGTDTYEQLNWLPHSQLKGLLSNIAAKHLLVISDSCFAGDLLYATRSIPQADDEYLRQAYSRVSRLVLTSGATEEVPDISEFARELKSVLSRNESPCLDASVIYSEVRLGVASVAPLLGILAGTGHQEGGSFLLFLREEVARAPKRTGRLNVTTDQRGVLILDGNRWGDLDEGSLELGDLELGEHRISIAYDDEQSDEKRVKVDDRAMETVFFVRRPPLTETPRAPASIGYLSAGSGFGGLFPVAGIAGVIGVGPNLSMKALYNFRLPWGDAGVGMTTGLIGLSTLEEAAYDYDMLSFPVALAGRVQVVSSSPWSVAFDLSIGFMNSRIQLHSDQPSELLNSSVFLAPSLGIGLSLFDGLRVNAVLGFLAVFFEGTPYTGISLGMGVEYAFGKP